jgi:hypothetical protein
MYSSQTLELDLMLEDLRDEQSVGLFAVNSNHLSCLCGVFQSLPAVLCSRAWIYDKFWCSACIAMFV